jgi:hypothetical protein
MSGAAGREPTATPAGRAGACNCKCGRLALTLSRQGGSMKGRVYGSVGQAESGAAAGGMLATPPRRPLGIAGAADVNQRAGDRVVAIMLQGRRRNTPKTPAAPAGRLAAEGVGRPNSTAMCSRGFNSPSQLSAIQSLCRQLICSQGEFANEYGCSTEALTV